MKLKYNSLLLVIHLLLYPFLTIINAQDSLYLIGSITGESTIQRIGGAIGVGDVNGDGYDDFIITMRTGNTVSDQGIVKLYFGSVNFDLNADVIFHYPGSDTKNDLGSGRGVGDINNDGYNDFVLIGGFGDWGFPKGKVFLYLGGETIDTIPVAEFYQPNAIQDLFGQTTKLGDINKDGYDDFAISSGYNWSNGMGYVYLFWGGDTISWERSIIFTSDTLGDFYGASVANIGDINNDSYDDLAISKGGGPSIDSPKTYIYYGGNTVDTIPDITLIGGEVYNIGDINGDERPEFIIRNEEGVNIYFSLDSVLTLKSIINNIFRGGDINNDGYDDFVIRNSYYQNSDSIMVGAAFIYLGYSTIDTVYDYLLEGETKWSGFGGTSFADINGDGYDDLLISASNYPDHENPLGKVYIYSYIKTVDVDNNEESIPNTFKLYQNYPNPFNPKTIIRWQQLVRSQVKITICDMLGSEVVTIIDEEKAAGNYEIEFDGSKYSLSSGVYFCELKIESGELLSEGVISQRIKMVLVK